MKHLSILLLLSVGLSMAAEPVPDRSDWNETFDSDEAFDQNWSAYGWMPDGKTAGGKEHRKNWWELKDGALQAHTSPGVHPSGLVRKTSGIDVRLSLRFKLPKKGLVGIGFNGPNRILDRDFHLTGVHITEKLVKAFDEDLLHPKGSPEAEKLKAEGKWNRKFIGAAKVTEMPIAAEVWHDLIMEVHGLGLRVILDGKEALTYTTKAADAEKTTFQLSVHSTDKAVQHGWFDDVTFGPLAAHK
jgi:hypothetical protein